VNDRHRTDPKHQDDITHATAVKREVHDALLDLWQTSGIMVLQQKDAPGTAPIITLITLGAIGLLAIFDYVDSLTLGTLHRHNRHPLPP
jgi:hypothetical protein